MQKLRMMQATAALQAKREEGPDPGNPPDLSDAPTPLIYRFRSNCIVGTCFLAG
jgi:hypothetical protein